MTGKWLRIFMDPVAESKSLDKWPVLNRSISNLVSWITQYRLSWRPGVPQETFGSWILASGSWILDSGLWIVNCELWIVNSQLWIMNYDAWLMIMIDDYDWWLWFMITIYDYDLSQTPFARSTRHTHRHFSSFRSISFCITAAVIP